MKYRLGLDLGVGSIGSAIIELDENNNAKNIIDAGVRIFEVSEGAADRRSKRTARKNLVRTRKRLQLLAKKLFENQLWVNKTPKGTDKLCSKSPYKIRYDAINDKLDNPNYIGRAILHIAKHRGAGFVSAAEEIEDDNKDDEDDNKKNKKEKKKSSYDMMKDHLDKTNSDTIGEFFYKRLQESYEKNEKGEKIYPEKRVIRQKTNKDNKCAVDYAIPRYLVKDEFNKIWDKQAQYFPQMQKEGLKKEIYDILFYEKAPAPYAIGKCIYFRDEDRLLKAHPLSEMRRIYEEVNNIRILTLTGKERLTKDQRDRIIDDVLLKGESAGKNKIREVLGLSRQRGISLADNRIIKGYLYKQKEFANISYIQNLSKEELIKFVEFLAEPKEKPNDKNSRLLNEDKLIAKLKTMFNITDEKVIGDILTKLPKGRAMLGITATKTILDELKKDVVSQREVTDKLKKKDAHFEAAEEIARSMQGKSDNLPYYGVILPTDTQPLPPIIAEYKKKLAETLNGKEKESLLNEINYGKVANPAVHMILNQLRLVVNDIIRIYGKPYDINIELGRDVGLSTKKKQELEKKQKTNKSKNDEAVKHLRENNLPINRDNIIKYKLWQEQNHTDAYNPTITIPRNFSGFEIEHIIPRKKGGTDTFNNLCLVNSRDNNKKGNMFAYDYFVSTKNQEEIRKILENARNLPKEKKWRFEPDAREHFEDFGDDEETTRYLTDTRYVSKLAARYLRGIVNTENDENTIHNRILPIKGGQTAELRKRWNLLGLEYDLMGLNHIVPRYIPCSPYWQEMNTGEIKEGINQPDIDGNWKFFDKTKNKEWMPKPRIDHRHHAMDAITIACVNRSLIQKLANEEKINHVETPLPLSTIKSVGEFRRIVVEKLQKINVSHKPNHSKAGQFHEETGKTVLGINPEDKKSIITVYSRKISQTIKSIKDLEKLKIPNSIKNEWHKDIETDKIKQEKLFNDFGLYINTAEQILIAENAKAVSEGKKEIKITEGRIISKAFKIIQEKKLWKGDKFREYENSSSLINIERHGVAYKSGNNHCIDFYIKDKKVNWEVMKRFDINQKDFIPNWKKEGGKIIWSIQQGDILELNTPEEWKKYTDKERCFAKVKKFSDGELCIDFISDARMTSPQNKEIKYMFVNSLRKGLSFYTKHKARKVELTAFGKIKKKHKVLWDGKKTAA
ncbi:MAG: type II CRISPR RNA-guided endonuclease Cas9 [Alphaproteobacteria bacterium]|nr:type II CRISPR RNA-guided endonuclease Cas9 [Alphaproteobacteria bacterium]